MPRRVVRSSVSSDSRALADGRTRAYGEGHISCLGLSLESRTKMSQRTLLFVALATLAATAVGAQANLPDISASEYAARRDSLAARIDSGVVVAFGGRTPVTDFGPFYQLPAFRYLTGF